MRRAGGIAVLAWALGFSPELRAAGDAAIWPLSSPLDYQVFQRSRRSEGPVVLVGPKPGEILEGDRWEMRWVGVAGRETWQPLEWGRSDGSSLRAEVMVPAGGWYELEVRLRRGNEVRLEARVPHVGVGEVFVVAGQSNSANHGEERLSTSTGRVAALGKDGWQLSRDPQPGASGGGGSFVPPFGDALAERFQVPVGIVAAGVGATSVREWLPKGTRFPHPPTLTGNVVEAGGAWEARGHLFDRLTARMGSVVGRGFRAVLWHQGESDAHQADATRTLPGDLYAAHLGRVIRESRRVLGREVPWFVAQVSYHVPTDPISTDIRHAQQRVIWDIPGVHAGPDSDSLGSAWRDGGGRGVHFSGPGLRRLASDWAERVGDWLVSELADDSGGARKAAPAPGARRLSVVGGEEFEVSGRPAFVFLPPRYRRTSPQPWVLYAPTLPGLPDEAERWMHERFLESGVAVAGIDVGEAHGSPRSHALFAALYGELTGGRGFASRPCLLGRSRGGLWTSSWALSAPERVAGLAGIYPVYDLRSYPGLTNAAPAYGLAPAELEARLSEFNPVERLGQLAKAEVPVFLIHGDVDRVVPLEQNSAELVRRYREVGRESLVQLRVLEGQGHNMFEGFFRSEELVRHVVARARAGAAPWVSGQR